MKKALELCALATQGNDFTDWWWKARLGKCYYQLGLLRDAERQFASSLKNQEMITTVQELCKIYLRMDQPNAALEQYNVALKVRSHISMVSKVSHLRSHNLVIQRVVMTLVTHSPRDAHHHQRPRGPPTHPNPGL